jgi:chromosome segregation ATPase
LVIQFLHEDQDQDVMDEGSRPGERAPGQLLDQALARIDALDRRLAAIERWAGMRPDLDDLDQEIAQVRREKEAAVSREDSAAAALHAKEKQLLAARAAREKEWAQAAAGRPSLAMESGRVNAEMERLRAVLREHGIEPGDDAA